MLPLGFPGYLLARPYLLRLMAYQPSRHQFPSSSIDDEFKFAFVYADVLLPLLLIMVIRGIHDRKIVCMYFK